MSFYFPIASPPPLPRDTSTAWPVSTETLPAPTSPFMHMWSSPSLTPQHTHCAPAAPPVLTLEPPAAPVPRRMSAPTASTAARAARDAQNYKTMLCKSLATRKPCAYETRCRYAHGVHELRLRPVSEVFKTKPCDSYAKSGACGYERHCAFLHDDILVRIGPREYWWVSAFDTIIHVEKVAAGNSKRTRDLDTRLHRQSDCAQTVANHINDRLVTFCGSNMAAAVIGASQLHAHPASEIFLAQLSRQDVREYVLSAAFKTLDMVVEGVEVGTGPAVLRPWPHASP